MSMVKWLMLMLQALPLAELAAFIAVAATIGVVLALGLVLAGSLAGALVLRHAGGNHIARVRVAMNQGLERGSFTALQADGPGGLLLLAGFLLLIPGFITDLIGLLVLVAALGRHAPPTRADGVVDLAPEQWRRIDDPALPGRRNDEPKGGPGR